MVSTTSSFAVANVSSSTTFVVSFVALSLAVVEEALVLFPSILFPVSIPLVFIVIAMMAEEIAKRLNHMPHFRTLQQLRRKASLLLVDVVRLNRVRLTRDVAHGECKIRRLKVEGACWKRIFSGRKGTFLLSSISGIIGISATLFGHDSDLGCNLWVCLPSRFDFAMKQTFRNVC